MYDPKKLWAYIKDRTIAYKLVFSNPAAEEVLADLADFCRANKSSFHADPRMHAVMEGRREVWLRIQNHLNMNAHQVYQHATGGSKPPHLEDEENG